MINKNFYRKTNDKKILHKVGKQWKVVSVALLMAIGGAAVASHVSANADAVNDTPYAANQAQFKQPVQKNKPVKPASSEAIHYYPEASGAAASYFDKVESDDGVAAKNYNTVNRYVQSLNSEYNPQVQSFSAKSASASSAESNDTKLASSYSIANNRPATAKTINSLAAKNSMDPSVYVNYVENTEQTYSGEVSSASADVKAANDVNSLVNKLENTNLGTASLNAATASGVAQSNLAAANDILDSVEARYNPEAENYSGWLKDADELSAATNVLAAEGNPAGYQAALNNLTNTQITNGASQAAARNAVNKAVNSDVQSAVADFKVNSANANDLYGFAENIVSGASLTNSDDAALRAANPANPDLLNGNGSEAAYTSAVSAAVAEQFAGTLRAAANSLYGKYNPESLTASARASVASSAINSAKDRVNTMSNLANIASANSSIVSTVYAAAGDTSNGAANYAASLLSDTDDNNDPLGNLEKAFGIDETRPDTYGPAIGTFSTYLSKLSASVTSGGVNGASAASLASDVESANAFSFSANKSNANDVASAAKSTADLATSYANFFSELNSQNTIPTTGDSMFGQSANSVVTGRKNSRTLSGGTKLIGLLSSANSTNTTKANSKALSALSNAVSDSKNGNTAADSSSTGLSLTSIVADLNNVAKELNSDATDATKVSATAANGFTTTTYHTVVPVDANNANGPAYASAEAAKAALLSDGIDVDALDAEAPAISNVNSAALSAMNSSENVSGFNHANSAANLSAALNDAANSAINAQNSVANSSDAFSASNDEDVTLASYYATSYSDDAVSESTEYSNVSSALNTFFRNAASDPVFNNADTAYADAEAAAQADKKMGVSYSKVVYNNSPHFLDVLKNAKLHSSYEYGSQYDKVLGSVNKGDRLTVLGVNFSREGDWRGQTRYLVLDNNNGKKGFVTGQPQYTKAAYLNAKLNTNNVDVSVKTLKPVQVMNNINGGKVVKTLPAGSIVDGVTIVQDNPSNDAMGFTKVETSDYNFFTANTDYVELNNVVPKNNNNNNNNSFNFNLDNTDLNHAYNDNSQY